MQYTASIPMAHHSPFSLCLLLLSLLAVATYSDYFILTSVHTCLSRSSGVHCPATLPANQGRWKIDAAEGPGRGPAVLCRITQYRNTAVYCGELYCVVESRNGVNRTLSLRAFRFNKARFFAKKKITLYFNNIVL